MIQVTNNLRLAGFFWGPQPLPYGAVMTGIVLRAPGVSGALIRTRTGIYCQGNAGVLRALPQYETEQAKHREMTA